MQISRTNDYQRSISIPENRQEPLNNENNRTIFGERLCSIERGDLFPEILNIRLNSSEIKTHEADGFTETWEGNDKGLIWGKKEAKDKSWREEWIEQRNIPKQSNIFQISSSDSDDEYSDNNAIKLYKNRLRDEHKYEFTNSEKSGDEKNTSFGQLTGMDYKENRRWKEKWFRKGRRLFVRKCIQQLCENNLNILATWYEDSEFNSEMEGKNSKESEWRLVSMNKYGRRNLEQKEWREQKEFHEDFYTVIYQERDINNARGGYRYLIKKKKSHRDNSELTYSTYFEGYDEESVMGIDQIENLQKPFTNPLESDFMFKSEGETGIELNYPNVLEFRNECVEIDGNGNKSGRKYGVRNKIHWNEVWFENIDGSKEYDKWFQNDEKRWGERHGYSKASNENFKVKWEENKDPTGVDRSRYIEKSWEKVGDNNTWGESFFEKTEQIPTEMEKSKKVHIKKDHWYNNGLEIYRECYNEVLKYECQDNSEDTLPIELIRSGEKRGERISTDETWSEDWNELLKKQSESKQLVRIELNTNKWWTKRNEKWGENKSIKLKESEQIYNSENNSNEKDRESDFKKSNSYVEKTECWYKSELEEFTDTWEIEGINCKGHKKGIDNKQKEKYIEWEEDWNKDQEGNLNKNCCWKVQDERGLIEMWTEETQEKKGKTNSIKKGVKFDCVNRDEIIEKWSETFNDDGEGNSYTSKQGKSKDSWYYDKFGKSGSTGEQWAIKQGYDREGSWAEKWTESEHYKEAWKKGENCHGDKWEEEWKEDYKNKWKWAQKSGQNSLGDKWKEEWREEIDTRNHVSKKSASKKGRKMITGEEWGEEWGESYFGIGNEFMGEGGAPAEYLEKWTNKYAIDGKGNSWGSSWGDAWNWTSKVDSWGENWANGNVNEKW
ncbi:putative at hook motif protein [Cryptosporidium felis]|nr:putative at hook motif protein [Cryptosporidium felis]